MKKTVSVIAMLLIASILLCACGNAANTEQTKDTAQEVTNIMQKSDPAQDNILNVLMIGNSFCYYYPDELVEMAKAAGKQLRICNVYYSGCSIQQHHTWWKSGEAKYDFFVRDTEGTSDKVSEVNLEYCLKQGNWDIISLQTAKNPTGKTLSVAERFEFNKPFLDDLVELLRTNFPKTRLVWHHTWSYQVGTASNGTVTTPDEQLQSQHSNREMALLLCDEYGFERVNTGEAWWTVRDGGYDNLCARLGKKVDPAPMDSGDGYHDGDIGGGQYLNACVWYEFLFGLDVRENTFVPTYDRPGAEGTGTLNKNGDGVYKLLIDHKVLQEAAHAAFTAGEAVLKPAN